MVTRLASLRTGFQGIPPVRPNVSLDEVWRHIESCLEALAFSVGEEGSQLNERGLTQRLVTRLESSPNHPYFFQKEYMEDDRSGNSRAVDIAVQVRATGVRILALEAKRLPTPGTGREREYLVGEMGGVERFKRGHHGKELKNLGMIGYVQRESFAYWRDTLNRWIDSLAQDSQTDLPWDEQDRLVIETTSVRLACLGSRPQRKTDGGRIGLRHLWVDLRAEADRLRRTAP